MKQLSSKGNYVPLWYRQMCKVLPVVLLGSMAAPVFADVAAHNVSNGVAIVQQQGKVAGHVVDAQGDPMSGVAVVVVGTKTMTITDNKGNFKIAVKSGQKLRFSLLGYETQVVEYSGGATLDVKLAEKANKLDEVVVVGFGTQKKVNLTGAVATVSSKDITARPINSVSDALQGVVPGMNFSVGGGGGALDSPKRFNIRGTGTIGSGSSVRPLVLIDGLEGSMEDLNPQDIANISILKDASASSIYGSRAAGGVVLITTKKGHEGRPVIHYNSSYRFNSPIHMPEGMNSLEYAYFFNAAGHSTMFSPDKIQQIKDHMAGKGPEMFENQAGQWEIWDDLKLLPVGNTDWMKEYFKNSFSQEHNVSVAGGSKAVKYYFSANYLDQNGTLRHGKDDKQRYNVMGRINAQVAPWAKLSYVVRFSRTDFENPSMDHNLLYHNALRRWPIIPVRDPNGHYTGASQIENLEHGGVYRRQGDVLNQQLKLVLEPIKNWIINAELNYKINNNFAHTDWLTTYQWDVKGDPIPLDNTTSAVQESASKGNYFNPNIYTSYAHDFGAHSLKGMVGYQSEWYNTRNFWAKRNGILSGVPTLNTTSDDPRLGGGLGTWSTAGFFGRLNYSYDDRYLAEVNLRYDGSSRFIKDKRWNMFPSFSLGWNVSQEEFWQPLKDKVNLLKVRASYGELGNQNTDNWYPFYSVMGYRAEGGNWLVNGNKPNISWEPKLVSALLTWEKNRTWDIGVDFGAFNNRLSGTFDYFQRKTVDMVGPAPELPDILGTEVPKVNNLDMTSKGWELSLTWRDHVNDFFYSASLMLSDNTVTIDKYPNDKKELNKYFAGSKLGDIWGYETVGMAKSQKEMDEYLKKVDQSALGSNWQAGDIMYADLNGDGKVNTGEGTLSNPGDLKVIGNSTPRYNFGLNLTGSWKGFDLKLFFQGVLKRDYMPGGPVFWGADGGKWQSIAMKEHLDYFRGEDTKDPLGPNLNAYYPQPDWGSGKNRKTQSRYLQNAAYCRLKNITLGYTLPLDISRRFYCQKMRVYVSGENVWTITNFTKLADPELIDAGGWGFGKTYPLSKTWSVGLNLTF